MRQSLLVFGALVFLGVGAAIAFWPQGTSDQSPNAASFAFQDWLVRCQSVQDKAGCGLTQQVVDQRLARAVLQLTVTSAEAGGAKMAAVVPLGVSVPDGVTLQVGEETRKFDYVQCLPGGCVALLDVDEALVGKMKSASDARLGVVDRTGAPIAMPVSLKGFAPAFDKMESKGGLGGGASWWSTLLSQSGAK